MLFNVGFYRKKVFANELGSVLIFIRLGIQPNAGSSRRRRAEIQQDRARLLLGWLESDQFLAAIHAHYLPQFASLKHSASQNCSLSASWIERRHRSVEGVTAP